MWLRKQRNRLSEESTKAEQLYMLRGVELMPRFKIVIHCTKLAVPEAQSGKNIIGFFTTRYGQGGSEKEAFQKAINRLQKEKKFKALQRITKESAQVEPSFQIEEIEKVPFYSGLFTKKTGYVLYPED
jgi:hypothetical protein